MATYGRPLTGRVEGEIILKPGDPGYFTVSSETLRQIEEIEHNIAHAKIAARRVIFR